MALSALSAWTTPACTVRAETFQTAVVLGAGHKRERLGAASAARLDAAIDLYARDRVRVLYFTGAASEPGVPPVAALMAREARAAGVPEAAIRVEGQSRSTLENALFSAARLEPTGDAILVTTGFHAWRGAASFAWAGVPPNAICRSGRFDSGTAEAVRTLLYESLKWPVNTARAAVWSGAHAIGIGEALPDWWLA